MNVFEVLKVCEFGQWVKIVRTNDYGEDRVIAYAPKIDIINDMNEDVFHALEYKVIVIKVRQETDTERLLEIICQDEYFFRSDKE